MVVYPAVVEGLAEAVYESSTCIVGAEEPCELILGVTHVLVGVARMLVELGD